MNEEIKQIYIDYSRVINEITKEFEYTEYTISEHSRPKLIFFYEENQIDLKNMLTQKTQELKNLALAYEVKSFALNPLKTPYIAPGSSPLLNCNVSTKYIKCGFENNDEFRKDYKQYLNFSNGIKKDEIGEFLKHFDRLSRANKHLYKNLLVRKMTNKFLLCYKDLNNQNQRISLCRGIFLPISFLDKIRLSNPSTERIDKIQYRNVIGEYLTRV